MRTTYILPSDFEVELDDAQIPTLKVLKKAIKLREEITKPTSKTVGFFVSASREIFAVIVVDDSCCSCCTTVRCCCTTLLHVTLNIMFKLRL
jgi:hypothetical protein